MLNVESIQNGIVIDHIPAGKGMDIYRLLELESKTQSVALLQSVKSQKYGCKDLIKIEGETLPERLDVLGYLDEIPVCVGYEIDGEVTTEFPTTHLLEKAKPVLKTLPGWKCDIRGIKKYEDLPENCRNYIEFIEKEIGYPITMVSNGPGRHDIIFRNK
jgi:adenylosuccinate synthase